MSSTAVVDQSQGLAEIASQLKALHQKAERHAASVLDPTLSALYAHLSRDLFDLTTKASSYAGNSEPAPRSPFGLLRTKDLKQSQQAELLAFYAEQIHAYLDSEGGSYASKRLVADVAQRLYTTQDEIWYGVTYGEQLGLFSSDGARIVLAAPED